MKLKLLLAFLALVAAFAAMACGGTTGTKSPPGSKAPLTKVRLALDWFPNSDHAGLYVAQAKGYFTQEGLDVTMYTPSDPSTVLNTVGAGQDDFGISYENEVLFAHNQDIPVVSIAALVQHPLNSLMALKSSGITRPRDLKGKKVGSAGVASDAPLLGTMLQADGLKPGDAEIVNVGYDLVPALISGKVDAVIGAYWTHEAIDAANQGFPVNTMRMEDWGVPDFYELVLVTDSDMIAKHPDVVQHFVNAVVKGYKDAAADPQKAIDTMKQAAPELDEKIERPGANLLAPLWVAGNTPFGTQTQAKWATFETWLRANNLLTKDVDVAKLYDNSFVQKAK